jgi:hypothetical protein
LCWVFWRLGFSNFVQGGLEPKSLISAFDVVSITGMSHQPLAELLLCWGKNQTGKVQKVE